MSIPKPPFHTASEELLYNIYLKLQDMDSLKESDINTLAKLNAILIDADLMKTEDIVSAINSLKGNVPVVGNTLEKLYTIIQGLGNLKSEDIDTLAEVNAIINDADVVSTNGLTNAINALKGNVPSEGDTLEKIYAMALAGSKNRIVPFYFESNLFTEQVLLFRGTINSISEDLSNAFALVNYQSRLDNVNAWTVHTDLISLQAWISNSVTGNEASGLKFWIKCIALYKPGQIGEAENLFSYQVI